MTSYNPHEHTLKVMKIMDDLIDDIFSKPRRSMKDANPTYDRKSEIAQEAQDRAVKRFYNKDYDLLDCLRGASKKEMEAIQLAFIVGFASAGSAIEKIILDSLTSEELENGN